MKYLNSALLVIGVVGVGSAAPVLAQDVQAYASASTSVVLMNGASQSIGAEIALEPGVSWTSGSNLGVTPVGQTLETNGTGLTSLTLVNPVAIGQPVSPNASVEAAVAAQITAGGTGVTFDNGVSYTRAWRSGLE